MRSAPYVQLFWLTIVGKTSRIDHYERRSAPNAFELTACQDPADTALATLRATAHSPEGV